MYVCFPRSNLLIQIVLPAQLKELTSLRSQNPSLRVLFSVGGASASGIFPDVIRTRASLDKFAASVLAFTLDNDLDGVDIDWEFPEADQSTNFTDLLQVNCTILHP